MERFKDEILRNKKPRVIMLKAMEIYYISKLISEPSSSSTSTTSDAGDAIELSNVNFFIKIGGVPVGGVPTNDRIND